MLVKDTLCLFSNIDRRETCMFFYEKRQHACKYSIKAFG
ncbi:hypothetical protein HMPREF9406_3401 [Clostridium sp. HGF2]|nr:hypothetical protein HMPREF9406_3401 [Clostridium sp. HGF2]EQJ51490.1 hypothetical protein QSI_4396 [Clostridioides difficile P28]